MPVQVVLDPEDETYCTNECLGRDETRAKDGRVTRFLGRPRIVRDPNPPSRKRKRASGNDAQPSPKRPTLYDHSSAAVRAKMDELGNIDQLAASEEDKEMLRKHVFDTMPEPEPAEDAPECAICLEPGEMRVLTCGHVFHRSCWTKWARVREVCPTCRKRAAML